MVNCAILWAANPKKVEDIGIIDEYIKEINKRKKVFWAVGRIGNQIRAPNGRRGIHTGYIYEVFDARGQKIRKFTYKVDINDIYKANEVKRNANLRNYIPRMLEKYLRRDDGCIWWWVLIDNFYKLNKPRLPREFNRCDDPKRNFRAPPQAIFKAIDPNFV